MSEARNKYQQELDEKKIILQTCQEEKSVKSCMECEKTFECEIRKAYVKAVYESMAHGQSGGFEF